METKTDMLNAWILVNVINLLSTNKDERRFALCTSLPVSKRNSARNDPSWPVMPNINIFSFFASI